MGYIAARKQQQVGGSVMGKPKSMLTDEEKRVRWNGYQNKYRANRYDNDPEYRAKVKERGREYYRKKQGGRPMRKYVRKQERNNA